MKAGIAGGGIMGQFMAWMLVNQGWQVEIFDAGFENNCSHAAAGLLTPAAELEKCDREIYVMGVAALLKEWPRILEQLSQPVYFRAHGSIMISHPRDAAELSRCAHRIINESPEEIKLIHADRMRELEPDLARYTNGYYLPSEGQIDNQALMRVLRNDLLANGVVWRNTRVKQTSPHRIHADNCVFQYDLVFDCRGMGAAKMFADLRAVRGEIIWLHASEVNITRPVRFMHPRYKLYLVPRPEHVYLIGASEIEAEDYSDISVQTMLELLSAVYAIHPGFSQARIIKTVTQCRPALQNHMPRIQYESGLIAINGLYRHGFLLAPVIASEVMQYVEGGQLSLRYPEIWRCAA